MHIKKIIIQGFKSYREQTVFEPFEKRYDIVVGRNGYKNDFFFAIQLVLSDEFAHLRPEQRQTLLNGDTGTKAYVEIVFDKSDKRNATYKKEIFVQRMIYAKKDLYFINMKVVPRIKVIKLLESVEFRDSNRYYIVKQAKINEQATAPDIYRLKLCDERKEESTSITENETEVKLEPNRSGESSLSAARVAATSSTPTHNMNLRKRRESTSDSQRQKKIKLPNSESIKLEQLNDDCILEIFKYLKLEDLSGMSETCVRLKRLANYYVQRKYPDRLPNSVSVSINKKGEITLRDRSKYYTAINFPIKSFVGCSSYVHIKRSDRKDIATLVRFLQTNWNGNVRKLSFEQAENIESFAQNIEAVLSEVEVLEYRYMQKSDNKAVNEILKYCSHLKYLLVGGNFLLASKYTHCPTLEVIEFDMTITDSDCVEKMAKFLQRNPNVSKLVCTFEDQSFLEWRRKLASIVQLITTVDSICELYLKIAGLSNSRYMNWNIINQELVKLDEITHFKRLELYLGGTNGWQICALQSLKRLFLGNDTMEDLPKTISAINQFAQLESLHLYSIPKNSSLLFTSLSQNLPNLEELHLVAREMHNEHFEFVASSPKLSKLILRLEEFPILSYEFVRDRLDSLGETRGKLQNACKMVIYLCGYHQCFQTKEFLTLPWLKKDNLVSLRTVEVSHELPHPDNPLLPVILN